MREGIIPKDLINISATLDYVLNSFPIVEADLQKEFLNKAHSLEISSEKQLSEMEDNANLIGVK